jgi:rare lipoprotein A
MRESAVGTALRRARALILFGLACASFACSARTPAIRGEPGERQRGIASYYGDAFHGKTTACGEPYDQYALTAAHRTLPFHTRVRVTNLANGRSVVLRINDRGPFVHGRIIDVSTRAAQDLDFLREGLAEVELEVIPP